MPPRLRFVWSRIGDLSNAQWLWTLLPAALCAAVLTLLTHLPWWADYIAGMAVMLGIIGYRFERLYREDRALQRVRKETFEETVRRRVGERRIEQRVRLLTEPTLTEFIAMALAVRADSFQSGS